MELKCSLPCSQKSCRYAEQHQSSTHTHILHLTTNFNIILPHTTKSSKWSLFLRFPHYSPLCTSLLPIRATFPAHLILFYFITRMVFDEQCRSSSFKLSNFLQSHIISSLLEPNILPSTLFLNTLTLCSILNVSDQVSHPYTTGKLMHSSVYINIYFFWYLKP